MVAVLHLHWTGEIFLLCPPVRTLLCRAHECLVSYLDDGSYSTTDYQEFLMGDGKYPAITICLEIAFYLWIVSKACFICIFDQEPYLEKQLNFYNVTKGSKIRITINFLWFYIFIVYRINIPIPLFTISKISPISTLFPTTMSHLVLRRKISNWIPW